MSLVQRLWHRLRGHTIAYRGRIQPNYSIGSGINVFVQDKFEAPMPKHTCSCGKTWVKGRW
jgi:hypothetical protein